MNRQVWFIYNSLGGSVVIGKRVGVGAGVEGANGRPARVSVIAFENGLGIVHR